MNHHIAHTPSWGFAKKITNAINTQYYRIELPFINLGFVRPTINQFCAAMELGRCQPSMSDILACPEATPCPVPADELMWDDVVDDVGVGPGGGGDGDGDDARRSVPINRRQFDAIKKVGRERLVLIQVRFGC
jgi:hypothetical protein